MDKKIRNNQVISKEINSLITKEDWSIRLFTELTSVFSIVFFGGVVRDILYGQEKEIRDIDLVLYPKENLSADDQSQMLDNIIKKICDGHYKHNQFHGYKILGRVNVIDIWLLKDTWAFRQELLDISPRNLLQSVYLNIDAYAWSYDQKKFISKCDTKVIHTIDIVLEKSACEILNLIRAVVLSNKYNMNLSRCLVDKLCYMLESWSSIEAEVFDIERKHYGNIPVKVMDIKNIVERQGEMYEKHLL